MGETEILNKFIKNGYMIQLVNPYAINFNDRFKVYKEFRTDNNSAVIYNIPIDVDKNGNIIKE